MEDSFELDNWKFNRETGWDYSELIERGDYNPKQNIEIQKKITDF